MKTKPQSKTRNPERSKRQAALAELSGYKGDIIVPKKSQAIYEADPAMLATTVKTEVQKRHIGELVSSAMTHRKVGVRALARKVNRSHSQIIALEQSRNMELSTLLTIADSLEFDVEIRLKPREGGKVLEARLR
jgi:hypothetical protein